MEKTYIPFIDLDKMSAIEREVCKARLLAAVTTGYMSGPEPRMHQSVAENIVKFTAMIWEAAT